MDHELRKQSSQNSSTAKRGALRRYHSPSVKHIAPTITPQCIQWNNSKLGGPPNTTPIGVNSFGSVRTTLTRSSCPVPSYQSANNPTRTRNTASRAGGAASNQKSCRIWRIGFIPPSFQPDRKLRFVPRQVPACRGNNRPPQIFPEPLRPLRSLTRAIHPDDPAAERPSGRGQPPGLRSQFSEFDAGSSCARPAR